MKIGIIGYGFVGKALANAIDDSVEVFRVDPKLKTTINQMQDFNPDIIFICLPTPMSNDGTQDLSIIENVLNKIKELGINSLIVVKSTVHPGNIKIIEGIFPKFVYNPEFLREKYANEDFIKSKLIVFGGTAESTSKLAEIYSKNLKCETQDYVFTDTYTASLIKYSINSFLATKVIFFNELKNLFDKLDNTDDWENFIDALSKDIRIGNSHMNVPGHDARLGFGGACLPKDSNAIINYADSIGVELGLLKNVVNTNNKIRAKYNNETDRENEQNISYKDQTKE